MKKTCNSCNQNLDLACFQKKSSNKDGYKGSCKSCCNPEAKEIDLDSEIRNLKTEIKILETTNKQLTKAIDTQNKVVSIARTSLEALPGVVDINIKLKAKVQKTKEDLVLACACWHIGEDISLAETGGFNEYNFDVFAKRFQLLIDKTLHFTDDNMSSYDFDTLHLMLAGDMVSGIIHELETSNTSNIVEQATLGALVAAQGIAELSTRFKIMVHCASGNHGRVKQNKYYKDKAQVNWDYIFYNYLALLLKDNKRVKFNIPLSPWVEINIKGYNFNLSHGDTIKNNGASPVNGLNREAAKWAEIFASQGKFFNYYIRSHFHVGGKQQTPAGENILIPSMKGGCPYAFGLPAYSDPIQLLFGVHEKYGKTWELPLKLKDAEGECRYKYTRSISLAEQING